jgi:hypothetical protein
MEERFTPLLIEKLILPAILAIFGWFVKDYLFAVYARRDELVRKEWERRLLEVWCPLYYWSGIVMLSGKEKGWERHGLQELETILTRSAHLLPVQHYNNLIRLIQTLTGQKTPEPTISDLKLTRQYIYNQIKTFNYLLYRRSGWFEATTYTDFFASAKYLVRFTSQALKHILVWVIVVALFGATYLAYVNKMYWVVAGILTCVSLPIVYDWYRQIKLHQMLNKQTKQ